MSFLPCVDLNSNPLSQTTMALYGDGSEAAIRAMLRQYLDIYARHDTCSTSSAVSTTGSARYRTISDEMNSRSRLRSSKWLVRKKADSLVSNSVLDYCSSPDSAVVTASESLGSSESIDSLEDSNKTAPSPSRTQAPSPQKRRNNRRYRRWCQIKRDSVDSCLSTESSSDNSVSNAEVKKVSISTKPLAVVRNTLQCPLIFPPGSYPPDQITTLPYYMPYFPAYPPPTQLLSYSYLNLGGENFVPHAHSIHSSSAFSSRNVTIDLTGHDISYFVENLPPIIPSPRSISNYNHMKPYNHNRKAPQPLMEINTNLFHTSSSYSSVHPPSLFTQRSNLHQQQHFPYVYIPAPLRVPRALDPCQSLKTCAVPFSEFSNYINSTPPTRKWRSLCNPSKNGFRFKVMSYNVLSANYATMNQFPYCPSWAIDWEYRRRGILEELRRYSPHVICLQEIDTDQFETIFQPELAKNNYEGIFVVKTRAHTKDAVAARKVDGCAIFWDSTKFNKIATFKHEFGYSCSHLGINPSSLLIERVMIRDNVAIDVVLEVKNSGAANGKRFCVATGHIHWDPECSDVKLTQTILWTSELWQHLEKLCGSAAAAARMPVILCGDFNSLPQSGVVEFLSNGSIPINHAEFLDNGFKFNFQEWNILDKSTFENNTVHHHFNLDRAYKTSTDGMEYTNMTYDFKGMIDYVFFSRNAFRLLSSLDQIPDSWFASERVVGCPHIHIPSDHFSLLVELDLLANPNFGSGGGGRGLAISDPPDNTSGNIGEDSTSGNPTSSGGGGQNSSSPATNSPKPKGSAGNRQKQGKR
ncbi:unnamed protein product [Hymenolepis diminuta]|uniref:Endo/exonuclease/phosphatase domain-containing protein n=1 Tax=Hymenolepis diminuta TaxID=6216 RepID=A0A0R3SU41_HYMDI|nr:unnamed protein product [Hymenolepis diminuta]